MPRYSVRFTEEAEEDLERLYDFLCEKDVAAAKRALAAIRKAIRLLRFSPYSCRRVPGHQVRELIVPFGRAGYVLLFEIEPPRTVTILAARHQREDDYH